MSGMTGPSIAAILESDTAWVCTVRPDGTPHLTPVWFVFRSDTCWICCTTGSVKARNVRLNPRVSVAVGDGDRPVVVEGIARLHEHQSEFPADIHQAFAGKYDWDIHTLEQDRWRRILIEVPIARWLLSGAAQ